MWSTAATQAVGIKDLFEQYMSKIHLFPISEREKRTRRVATEISKEYVEDLLDAINLSDEDRVKKLLPRYQKMANMMREIIREDNEFMSFETKRP